MLNYLTINGRRVLGESGARYLAQRSVMSKNRRHSERIFCHVEEFDSAVRGLRGIDLKVLDALIFYANCYDAIFPSQVVISLRAGYSASNRSDVNRSLGRLASIGLIRKSLRRKRNTCMYSIHPLFNYAAIRFKFRRMFKSLEWFKSAWKEKVALKLMPLISGYVMRGIKFTYKKILGGKNMDRKEGKRLKFLDRIFKDFRVNSLKEFLALDGESSISVVNVRYYNRILQFGSGLIDNEIYDKLKYLINKITISEEKVESKVREEDVEHGYYPKKKRCSLIEVGDVKLDEDAPLFYRKELTISNIANRLKEDSGGAAQEIGVSSKVSVKGVPPEQKNIFNLPDMTVNRFVEENKLSNYVYELNQNRRDKIVYIAVSNDNRDKLKDVRIDDYRKCGYKVSFVSTIPEDIPSARLKMVKSHDIMYYIYELD